MINALEHITLFQTLRTLMWVAIIIYPLLCFCAAVKKEDIIHLIIAVVFQLSLIGCFYFGVIK